MRRKRGIERNALGRSRGGFSTKVHALVNAKGDPYFLSLTAGHRHESTAALDLLEHARGKAFLGDAGHDSNELIDQVRANEMKPVICPNKTRKNHKLKLDKKLYRKRSRVEVFFDRLRRFRSVASRHEKTAKSYLAVVHVACMMLRLGWN